jgi:hypothetical protein
MCVCVCKQKCVEVLEEEEVVWKEMTPSADPNGRV